jgi:nicotinamide riboside kinase
MVTTEPRLICLIGAECCGKTTLARQLAAHTGARLLPELLRGWCELRGRSPRQDEQAALMLAQIEAEDQQLALARQTRDEQVICDTGPLLTAVYSVFYFADPSLLAAAQAHHARYDLTLWLQPDLPWQADAQQRDGPAARLAVHHLLAQQLAQQPRVCAVQGQGSARLQAALAGLAPSG